MVKPGWRTSEFYLALLGTVLPVLKEHVLPGLPVESVYAIVAYIISRGLVKMLAARR